MTRSGVVVDDECVKAFEEMKSQRLHKYLIMQINTEGTTVVVVDKGNETEWDVFRQKLLDCKYKNQAGKEVDGPAYAVYDFEYNLGEDGVRQKLALISWCPESAPPKAKMVFSSSKDAVRKELDGFSVAIDLFNKDELEYDDIISTVSKGKVA